MRIILLGTYVIDTIYIFKKIKIKNSQKIFSYGGKK